MFERIQRKLIARGYREEAADDGAASGSAGTVADDATQGTGAEENPWEAFLGDEDEVDDGASASEAPTESPETGAASEEADDESGQEPPASEEPSEQQEPPANGEPEPTKTEETAQKPDGEEKPQPTEEELKAQREELISTLAKANYALTEEQADAIIQNPAETIPRLFASMQVHMQETLQQQMLQTMPQQVMERQQIMVQQKQTAEKFFGEYPQLKNHAQDVVRAARIHREMHPDATVEQRMSDVGKQLYLMHGYQLSGVQEETPPPAQKDTGHVPANPRGVAPSASPPADENKFATMVREIEEDMDS